MGQHRRRTARTPLLGGLAQALGVAHAARRKGAPPADELLDMSFKVGVSRRDFLRSSAVLGMGALVASTGVSVRAQTRAQATAPRIAVIGAGISGLNTAYQLQKAGYSAVVYEASARIGGRMDSRRDVLVPGLTTEFGAEFINSDHDDMLALVDELGLDLIDRQVPSEAGLRPIDYFYEGRMLTHQEIIDLYAPFAGRIEADLTRLDENWDELLPEYDALSISEYLDQLGMDGLLRTILESAFTYENGSPASSQSLLNFLYLMPTSEDGNFEVIGGSDERYKVRGGNQLIPLGLAERLDRDVQLGHKFEAARTVSGGCRLTFQTDGGVTDVDADYVVFALPFTLLRHAQLDLDLPPDLREAIHDFGYGTSAKVMAGMNTRPWRAQGASGYSVSDTPYVGTWDNSQTIPGDAGGLTMFAGGMEALAFADGTPEEAVARLLPHVERLYPGVIDAYNGNAARAHWPTYQWALAGYSSPRPGQTHLFDVMSEPHDNLLFVGEHTSADYWGFMNGAAESGRRAAETLVELLGG
ncbi:MAG: FAD-dependent oxidoreductase [Anaerolinea sp.]|nr:FAD-dependent oxidoreductase [Anaerolinea sp.]